MYNWLILLSPLLHWSSIQAVHACPDERHTRLQMKNQSAHMLFLSRFDIGMLQRPFFDTLTNVQSSRSGISEMRIFCVES